MTIFGITPWHSILPFLIAIPVISASLLWLAWLNFSHYLESRRLWQRNILGLAGMVVFFFVLFASSAAFYNRAWEMFEPAEPPHGPAKFSSSAPPPCKAVIMAVSLVQLSDGRIWCDSLGRPFKSRPKNHVG